MRADQFEKELQKRAAPGFSHMVRFTDHALEQIAKRRLTRMMVIRILQRGSVGQVRWNKEKRNWSGHVTGVTAGVEVDVRCALPPGDMSVIVVTAINKGEPK